MKYIQAIILLLALTTISCKKENVVSSGNPQDVLLAFNSDTSYTDVSDLNPQQRNVLVQEFTGVYCYTCPLAHDTVRQIMEAYPNRISTMNIHSHLFSIYDDPSVMGNKYDFRTLDGDTIVKMLGGINSIPSAATDMAIMNSEVRILSSKRGRWYDYVTSEIATQPKINIELATSYNAANQDLKIVAKYHILENMNKSVFYSLGIIENEIIDWQFVNTAAVENYHHQHILRDMLTDAKGEVLSNTALRGEVIVKVFHIKVPADYNYQNLEIVSYAHQKNNLWDVYQAAYKKVQE